MSNEQLELGDDVVLRRAWNDTLRKLSSQVSVVTFESYIKTIRPISFTDGVITLGVGSAFAREWIQKYQESIRKGLEEHFQPDFEIRYVIVSPDEKPILGDLTEQGKNSPVRSSQTKRNDKIRMEDIPSKPLLENYTFENYLPANSNRLAYSAAIAVAANPGKIYNPLFIHGNPGLGKTHLLHAIGNAVVQSGTGLRVAVIDGETFTQTYVSALRERKVEEFRRRIRSVDVWLVDDIQQIAGREQTKEEFYHTYNALYQAGKQIVLCSDRSPLYLQTLDERLTSRFSQGLVADVATPELETREAIMVQMCEQKSWKVPNEVISFIASAIHSNVRALEGSLTKLVAFCSVMKKRPSIELAQDVLADYLIQRPTPGQRMKTVSIEAIQIATAEEYGTTQEHLRSESKDRDVTIARQTAMYLAREMCHESLAVIGKAFLKEHTTVQRAHTKIKSMLSGDKTLENHIFNIKNRLER